MAQEQDKAFRVAKLKIKAAQLSGATGLELSGRQQDDTSQLRMLPDELRHLTQLQSLNIANNKLEALPEWLKQFTQLQSLNVSNNRLTILPEWLRDITQLEYLYLSGNPLTEMPGWLGEFTQLQSLSVANNKLETLPEWIGSLSRLQSLDVSNNKLLMLPEWLERLTDLRKIIAARNLLTSLPDSISRLNNLEELYIPFNKFAEFPKAIRHVASLQRLYLMGNALTGIPESISELQSLKHLNVEANKITHLPAQGLPQNLKRLILGWTMGGNPIYELPSSVRGLKRLEELYVNDCKLSSLPDWLGKAKRLRVLYLDRNMLTELPASLARLERLEVCSLNENPLSPELAAAYEEGFDALKRYLRLKAKAQVILNEAKLIIIGEGEVGKSCLLSALRNEPWEEGTQTTHGIEIKPVKVTDPIDGRVIKLNGWDFGGQQVYRPTHQLFFSSPAVYLIVWKPREGSQQGLVKDWIKLVKHREPDAKILIVATHGGPGERQPDIDRQEIWDIFGRDMIVDFFWVESKPDKDTKERKGIDDLKQAIARVAASLPEMGRTVPRRWDEIRNALNETGAAYLPLEQVLQQCRSRKMYEEEARDFVRVSHKLGHLLHYEHDPVLRDIVVLKPDWLTRAISFVLDDKQTRASHGLVQFSRLVQLWNDPTRPKEDRYDQTLHPLFLRLMERFDISYKVTVPSEPEDALGFWQRIGSSFGKTTALDISKLHYTSLIAQLVPDIRPDPIPGWFASASPGDQEQAQICRIVETKTGQSAAAEGLFFQLIVRLHKYSLGRFNYTDSVHWQRGMVLEDDYGSRALLEHFGNDIRIIVRSPYPEQFLAALTYEVKWLVENFWAGLRCDVMVPCLNPTPCIGMFEVRRLLENKKRNRPEQPCPVCNEWQNIEQLLHNAPTARQNPLEELLTNSAEAIRGLTEIRSQLRGQQAEFVGRFNRLDASSKVLASKVEAAYTGLMRTLTDEAKDGPRLFSFEPIDPGFLDRPKWISEKFRITLWCEHSRLPLPALNGKGDKRGVYELTLPRDWVVEIAPFLKILASTISLVMPVAASATKLMLDEASYKGIEKQLDFGHKSLDSVLKGGEKAGSWMGRSDAPDLEQGEAIQAHGAALRKLHALLKEKDPSFGDLVRVQNKRHEFLWVHPQFEQEY